jgi:hypothetical protein
MSFDDERQAIIGVLEFTGRALEHLISTLQPESRKEFEDVWYGETRLRLDEAIGILRGEPPEEDTRARAYQFYEARGHAEGHDIEDWERAERELSNILRAENGPFHRLLRRVGLAGKSLKLKLRYLAEAATSGWPGKLLKLLNKFLGSLASAVHASEAVKEFKEWLEDLVIDRYDPILANLYSQSGADPFHMEKL